MPLSRQQAQRRRHARVRRKVSGTSERPRLCIHKSLKHLYAQVIDDRSGHTLCFATTNVKANKSETNCFCNIAWAKKIGEELGKKARAQGVQTVVFDRGGYRYHGIVRAFAEALRESGLKF